MHLFSKLDWKAFFIGLYRKIVDTDLLDRAAQIGFYFSFAFFPLLFFLVTLFGLVLESTDGLKRQLYNYLAQIMPYSAFDLVRKTLDEVVENSSGGKLTLGLFITLWSASAGVDSIRTSLNSVYELRETRAWWNTKLQSLVLTLLFILLIAIVIAGVTSGLHLVRLSLLSMGLEVTSPWLLSAIQWAVIIIVMLFTTGVIFSWIPNFDGFKWVWISPGAIVAIILWIAFTGGFRLYLQYFNTYNKAYGSLGAVIILMLWMFLTGTAILIGGAINSVLANLSKREAEETSKQTAGIDPSEAV